jgi:hypothetical protein
MVTNPPPPMPEAFGSAMDSANAAANAASTALPPRCRISSAVADAAGCADATIARLATTSPLLTGGPTAQDTLRSATARADAACLPNAFFSSNISTPCGYSAVRPRNACAEPSVARTIPCPGLCHDLPPRPMNDPVRQTPCQQPHAAGRAATTIGAASRQPMMLGRSTAQRTVPARFDFYRGRA